MAAVRIGVPRPIRPDETEAWYAPEVRAQYAIERDVVATVAEGTDAFTYEVRRPFLRAEGEKTRKEIADAFEDATLPRPRTREEATDRMNEGMPTSWRTVSSSLGSLSPASARRVEYHLCADLRALGTLTGLALDDRVRIGDVESGRLLVHTRDFAPALTDIEEDTPHLDRVLSERLESYTVPFGGHDIPVTVLSERLLGRDTFDRKYVVQSPDRLPKDDGHIAAVTSRIRGEPHTTLRPDLSAYIERRARQLLQRRLAFEKSRSVTERIWRAVRRILPGLEPDPIPPTGPAPSERVTDLLYYVLRDLVGDGPLTIPLRDERIRYVEANRPNERITVVPHDAALPETGRMPTTLSFGTENRFLAVTERLAAEGGVELTAEKPAATVDIQREAGEGYSLRCAVSLPAGSDEGPHISIRRSRRVPPTPVTLIELDRVTVEAVAAVWTVAEAGGRVLFAGPDASNPRAVLLAHLPFVPSNSRPVAFEKTGAVFDLPHETGLTVSAETPATEDGGPGAHLDGLNADVAVIPELAGERAYARFQEHLAAGRAAFAAARIDDPTVLGRIAAERGVPPALFATIDLLVQLAPPDDDRGPNLWTPNIDHGSDTGPARCSHFSHRDSGTTLSWDRIKPSDDDPETLGIEEVLQNASRNAPGSGESLPREFERRRRYVEYQRRQGMTDRASLLSFLADLRTDEAATVERIKRVLDG
ncbi:MAG: secretion system protein [Halodesulfurarchaeum sp.]